MAKKPFDLKKYLAEHFTQEEIALLRRLSSPIKIQDYLDSVPTNYEKEGETIMSPRRALRRKKTHCLEGAMLAALALWFHGEEPLLMDMKGIPSDEDHVIALYRKNGYWGAISKTNHATLRFRDPVYKTVRELAMSYFHEYFSNRTRQKTLRQYSGPFNLKNISPDWMTSDEELWHISWKLDEVRHYDVVPKKNLPFLRKADKMELRAAQILEWKKENPRT